MSKHIGTKVDGAVGNEFRLTRVEALKVYCDDHRAKGEFIMRELPVKPSKGDKGYRLRTGALLVRVSKRGMKPYTVHGEGALEALTVKS